MGSNGQTGNDLGSSDYLAVRRIASRLNIKEGNEARHSRQAQLFPNRLWGRGTAIEQSLQLS